MDKQTLTAVNDTYRRISNRQPGLQSSTQINHTETENRSDISSISSGSTGNGIEPKKNNILAKAFKFVKGIFTGNSVKENEFEQKKFTKLLEDESIAYYADPIQYLCHETAIKPDAKRFIKNHTNFVEEKRSREQEESTHKDGYVNQEETTADLTGFVRRYEEIVNGKGSQHQRD